MAGPTTSARLSGTFRAGGNIPPACLAENNHFTDVRISGYSTEFLNTHSPSRRRNPKIVKQKFDSCVSARYFGLLKLGRELVDRMLCLPGK